MTEPLVVPASWRSRDRPGCVGVEVSGLAAGVGLSVAMLRFAALGTFLDRVDATERP